MPGCKRNCGHASSTESITLTSMLMSATSLDVCAIRPAKCAVSVRLSPSASRIRKLATQLAAVAAESVMPSAAVASQRASNWTTQPAHTKRP